MTELDQKKRRTRGPSAWGDFEQAKIQAHVVLQAQREADRAKSERLKAMRLASASARPDQ